MIKMQLHYLCSGIILVGLLSFQKKANAVSVVDGPIGIYQWMVNLESIPSSQATSPLRAYLWIPPECKDIKGVVLACHNLQEEGTMTHPDFRKAMTEMDFAEIWVTPGWNGIFDVKKGTQIAFEETLDKLADVSGYSELRYAPIVYMGHSAQASGPWHFGAWNPDRTLAMISLHGDSPLSDFLCCNHINPDWEGIRNIDGIPGLVCIGEHEWMEERIRSSFVFQKNYPNSTISLLCDAGHWHNDISKRQIDYLNTFIRKAFEQKMPVDWDGTKLVKLKKLNPEEGWLADRWHPEKMPTAVAASYAKYKGDRDSAFWYFDEEMVRMTENYYVHERGKQHQYINILQNAQFVSKEQEVIPFSPETDGVTFHVKLAFTDSTGQQLSDQHSVNPILLQRISGPVEIVNDTTFRLKFYRAGVYDRRSGDIDIMAYSNPDDIYRRGWRRLALQVPLFQTDGTPQEIVFPEIENTKTDVGFVELNATASSGLPVSYYINGGPAIINGNKVLFLGIPPKAKYPIKVGVVAWQHGTTKGALFQSAKPVERFFFIYK